MKYILTLLISLAFSGQIGAQCLQTFGCSATPMVACDTSKNDPEMWNELYWWDNLEQTHNLSEGSVDLSLTVTDSCAGAVVNLRYLLFLDLDHNGSWETVVKSWEPPAPGTVNYNNWNNPNFEGGDVRVFDERPVTAEGKYQFALETISSGDTIEAKLRWNTPAEPNNFAVPELPYATHKIKWLVEDNLGNNQICEHPVVVKDCKAPTVVCLNGLSVNIMPTGLISIWASDFLQYTEDNSSPNPLQIGIRKCGTGTGFPVDGLGNPLLSLYFTCTELGSQCVELWARDAAGNADYCETAINVQDNMNICSGQMSIASCIKSWCSNAPVLNTLVNIDGTVNFAPPFSYFNLIDSIDANGCSHGIDNNIPISSSFTIYPEKDDDPLNGVTVFDLIKIKRFLMGFEDDFSPYAMVAADVNKSGSITGFDLLELRKLMVGFYTELPNNTSWRFIDADFDFNNPQNPFEAAFPEYINIADALLAAYQANFNAVKIGDVDCDAWTGFGASSQGRGLSTRNLSLPDATLLAGETAEISLQMAESGQWEGLQMGLQFDSEKIEILEVLTGDLPELDADAFHQPRPGILNFVWAAAWAEPLRPGRDLLRLRVKAKASIKVSEVFQLSSELDPLGSFDREQKALGLEFRAVDSSNNALETNFLAPIPNPTSTGSRIPIHLFQSGQVNLEIFDSKGKLLWTNEVLLNAGSHLLEIPAQALPQAGLYVWRAKAGPLSAQGKLLKI